MASVLDIYSKKEVPFRIDSNGQGNVVYCDIKVGKKEIGSMCLHKGKKDFCVVLLKNTNPEKHIHVGKALIEHAVQISKSEGFGGRLSTFATQNAHAFFYSMGFRSLRAETNEFIQKAIAEAKAAGKKADTVKLQAVLMFREASPEQDCKKG
jgi:hypothetical protein